MRLGSEVPRVFTPPLRELTPETSLGFEVVEFATDVLGVDLYPWQRWLLVHGLELESGSQLRFRKVFVMVGRQNGKSTLLQVLTLWRLYVDRAPLVLGTAQDRGIARDQWLGAVEIAQGVEELAAEIQGTPVTTRGFERFALRSGERYEIAASSRRAGRGKAVDLLLMDELREHQSWEAWSAVSKTTNARPNGQVWAVSSAGDSKSVVLNHFRLQAHAALGDPDGVAGDVPELPDDAEDALGALALFEWSAAPGRDVWDRDGWSESNPSMGFGALTERTVAADAASDPEHVFRTEVLCQVVTLAGSGPFPAGAWVACLDSRADRDARGVVRDRQLPAAFCVDVSHDRTMAYIAVAFWDSEGRRRVELAAQRAGTDWVAPWLLDPGRAIRPDLVTLQTNGAPVSSLFGELRDAGVSVVEWAGPDIARACGQFYDAVRSAVADEDPVVVLTHGMQPSLDVAATSAVVRPLGDGWAVDRRNSPEDAAPLMAAIGAHWLLRSAQPLGRSAYESGDLLILD